MAASVITRLLELHPDLEERFSIRLKRDDISLEEIAGIPVEQTLVDSRINFLRERGIIENGDFDVEGIHTLVRDIYYAACGETLEYKIKKKDEPKDAGLEIRVNDTNRIPEALEAIVEREDVAPVDSESLIETDPLEYLAVKLFDRLVDEGAFDTSEGNVVLTGKRYSPDELLDYNTAAQATDRAYSVMIATAKRLGFNKNRKISAGNTLKIKLIPKRRLYTFTKYELAKLFGTSVNDIEIIIEKGLFEPTVGFHSNDGTKVVERQREILYQTFDRAIARLIGNQPLEAIVESEPELTRTTKVDALVPKVKRRAKEADADELADTERSRAESQGYLPLGFVLDKIRTSGRPHRVSVSPSDARELFESLQRYSLNGKDPVEDDEGKYISGDELELEINSMLSRRYHVDGLVADEPIQDEEDAEPEDEDLNEIEEGDSDEREDAAPVDTEDETDHNEVVRLRNLKIPYERPDTGYRPLQRGRPTKVRRATLINYNQAVEYVVNRLTRAKCSQEEIKGYVDEILGCRVIDLDKSVFPKKDRKGNIVYKSGFYVKELISKFVGEIATGIWLERMDSGNSGVVEVIRKEDL